MFQTIRRLRKIRAGEPVPVTVLSIPLFTDMILQWKEEDERAASGRAPDGESRPRAAGRTRIYQMARQLYEIWRWTASQPDAYPGIAPVPAESSLVLPDPPAVPPAPPTATWHEMDAVVRLAYADKPIYGDLLAGERGTGLRVDQVASIRRGALSVRRRSLIVERGKTDAEEVEQREIPVPLHLLDLWAPRLAAAKDADDFIFPAKTATGHLMPSASRISDYWREAEEAGEVRRGLCRPRTHRKGRPNHAFRAGYMASLEAVKVLVDGQPVRLIVDSTIDHLVGHHPATTRGKHYVSPDWETLVAAVNRVPPVDFRDEHAACGADNVVPFG